LNYYVTECYNPSDGSNLPDGINYFFDYATQEIVFELQPDFDTSITGDWYFKINVGLPQKGRGRNDDGIEIILRIPTVTPACPPAVITSTTQTTTYYEYEIGVDVEKTYQFDAFTISEACATIEYTMLLTPASFTYQTQNANSVFVFDSTLMQLRFKHTNQYELTDYGDFKLILRGKLANGDISEVQVDFKIKLTCKNTPITWSTTVSP